MALILNIETSTEVCSAALAQDGLVTHLRENLTGQNHAMLLTIFIQELLAEADISVDQLDALAVSGFDFDLADCGKAPLRGQQS